MKRNKTLRSEMMKICETGRSMIEMLGVLAIIGVLSVGSMAGYSKMMSQYKIDSSLEYVGMIVSKVSAFGSSADSYAGLNSYTAYKLNAVPSDMLVSYNADAKTAELTNPFGGGADVRVSTLVDPTKADNQAYVVVLNGLNEEACIALGSSAWKNVRNSSFVGLGVGSSESNIEKKLYLNCTDVTQDGDYAVACAGGTLPMDISDATSACSKCGDNCTFMMKFY